MATVNNFQAITIEAGADLSAGQYRFVLIASDGQVDLVSSAGGDADGILMGKPSAAGKAAEIAISGVAKIVVGTGDLSAGDKVQSDASGEGIQAASADHVLGKCLKDGVDGEIVPILLVSKHILA